MWSFIPSAARGVGHIRRPTIVSKFGNRFGAHEDSGVIVAAIALHVLGVGHVSRFGFSAKKFLGPLPPERSARAFVLLASGVGNQEDPVTAVRGTDGGSRYAIPLRVVPARGQVPENSPEVPASKESWNVLHEDESGSYSANGSDNFRPKVSFIGFS